MEIAIIAHDGKKAEMIQFLMDFKALILAKEINLISTGTTGKNAEKAGFKVRKFLSGHDGGDDHMAARGAEGITSMGTFFSDQLGMNRD